MVLLVFHSATWFTGVTTKTVRDHSGSKGLPSKIGRAHAHWLGGWVEQHVPFRVYHA
jgi:hypothetical protein